VVGCLCALAQRGIGFITSSRDSVYLPRICTEDFGVNFPLIVCLSASIPPLFRPLARLSLLEDHDIASIWPSPLAEHVQRASRWLLCSFVRAVPELLEQLFQFYGISEEPLPKNLKVLAALSQVCQSKQAVERMQVHLEYWVQKAVQICEYDGWLTPHSNINNL